MNTYLNIDRLVVSNLFGKRAPDGGGSNGDSFVVTGLVLVVEWWRQEVGIRAAEAAGQSLMMDLIREVTVGLVIEGFVS